MFSALLSVGFLILIISTIILSIFTISRDQSLIALSTFNPSGLSTSLYQSFGAIQTASLTPDSIDVAGSVVGSFSAPGDFEVIVKFSSPYIPAPKSVMLTPAAPSSGIPIPGYLLSVADLTSTQFEVAGTMPVTLPLSTLFYYSVV